MSAPAIQPAVPAPVKPGPVDRAARALVFAGLRTLSQGQICIFDADGRHAFGRPEPGLEAAVTVRHPRFYRDIALGGDIGAADAYIDGRWDCDDLTALTRIAVRNSDFLQSVGRAQLSGLPQRFLHALRRNTRRGSRKNIAAHYDLGNNFFRLFLDDTMMYSCAIFPHPDAGLPEASRYKHDRICRKLALRPQDHLLEIGTGWGGFALHAAANYGCRVTTTTLSQQQYDLARERVAEAGLEHRIRILLEDYRSLTGAYDKLVSIEMIEAVGHQYYDAYFGACARLLNPDGLMLLQAITIDDRAYERAKRAVDFIKTHIFPGSCIPSVAAITASLARAADLRPIHLEDIGPHYARTLQAWRNRFLSSLDRVRALGYPESFIRTWEYYFCYCEGGFRERYISDIQLLLAKPLNRRAPILPPLPSNP